MVGPGLVAALTGGRLATPAAGLAIEGGLPHSPAPGLPALSPRL